MEVGEGSDVWKKNWNYKMKGWKTKRKKGCTFFEKLCDKFMKEKKRDSKTKIKLLHVMQSDLAAGKQIWYNSRIARLSKWVYQDFEENLTWTGPNQKMLYYLVHWQNESKDKMNQKMFSHLAEWQNELLQIFESVMHLQRTIRSMKELVSMMVYMKKVSTAVSMK